MSTARIVMILLLTMVPAYGCASSSPLRTAMARSKLQNLEIAMSKDQVVGVMGKPYTREVFLGKDGSPVEVLFYHTAFTGNALFIEPDERHLTPVLLKDGKVIGWGRNFYDNTVRYHVEHEMTVN